MGFSLQCASEPEKGEVEGKETGLGWKGLRM